MPKTDDENHVAIEFRDIHGRLITFEQWAELQSDASYVEIGSAQWWSGEEPNRIRVMVSTIWVGLPDAQCMFETMGFAYSAGGVTVEVQERYVTREEAAANHQTHVTAMRELHPVAEEIPYRRPEERANESN